VCEVDGPASHAWYRLALEVDGTRGSRRAGFAVAKAGVLLLARCDLVTNTIDSNR